MNLHTILHLFYICEALVNRSGLNAVSTNSDEKYVYVHACSPNDVSKNQLNNYLLIG